MAGIGFRLQQVADRGTYLHGAAAYASAGVIVAGPWLVTVVSLVLLDRATVSFLSADDRQLLFATITYAFAASLLLTAGPQMVLTRFVADRLYLDDVEVIAPTCTGVVLVAAPALLAVSVPFLLFTPFDLSYRVLTYCLLSTTSLLWLSGIFISAARDYARVVLSSVVGYGCGLSAAAWLGQSYGVNGALGGFVLGQTIWLALFVEHIHREFPAEREVSLEFVAYFQKFWDLGLSGAIYYFGLWADKILYWLSPSALVVHDFYRIYPPYDSAIVATNLLVLPALSLILIRSETQVAVAVRHYVARVNSKFGLAAITQAKTSILESMTGALCSVVKLHLIVSLLAFAAIAAGLFSTVVGTNSSLFKVMLSASGGQLLLFLSTLFLLYLDQRRPVLLAMSIFACVNVAATTLTIALGETWYGLGYLTATIVGTIVAMVLLYRRLRKLEFITFMLQPIVARSG